MVVVVQGSWWTDEVDEVSVGEREIAGFVVGRIVFKSWCARRWRAVGGEQDGSDASDGVATALSGFRPLAQGCSPGPAPDWLQRQRQDSFFLVSLTPNIYLAVSAGRM